VTVHGFASCFYLQNESAPVFLNGVEKYSPLT
jgi:hypothetical protein